MTNRFGAIYLLGMVLGAFASIGVGSALGRFAAGGIDPASIRPRLADLKPANEPRIWTAAASDIAGQWPVGSPDAELGLTSAR